MPPLSPERREYTSKEQPPAEHLQELPAVAGPRRHNVGDAAFIQGLARVRRENLRPPQPATLAPRMISRQTIPPELRRPLVHASRVRLLKAASTAFATHTCLFPS